MSASIGDGLAVIGLAAGYVGYTYVIHLNRKKRLEIIHEERMAAMDKGIPLPEFSLEPPEKFHAPDPDVLPILGTVLLTLSVGTMIVLYRILPDHGMWVSPLPFAFLGAGLLAFHFLNRE